MENLIDSVSVWSGSSVFYSHHLILNIFLLQFSINTLRNSVDLLGAQQENRLQLGLAWRGIRLFITKGRLLRKLQKWLFSWRISISREQRMSTSHQCLQPAGKYSTKWEIFTLTLTLERFYSHFNWRLFPSMALLSIIPSSWELGGPEEENKIYLWIISLQAWSLFVRANSRCL